MRANDDTEAVAADNYSRLLKAAQTGRKILIDATYYLWTNHVTSNITSNTVNKLHFFARSIQEGKLLLLGDDCKAFFGLSGSAVLDNVYIGNATANYVQFINQCAPFINDIEIKYCYITGNIRMLNTVFPEEPYWNGTGHNYTTGPTYMKNIIIRDNTFYDIYNNSVVDPAIGRTIFNLTDVPVYNGVIDKNTVTNFSYIFYQNEVTTGCDFHEYLRGINRLSMNWNTVINADDYDALDKNDDAQVGQYHCFVQMVGYWATVTHNHFEGIHLVGGTDLELYDNYFNVTHLEYDDNVWKNCINFNGTTGTAQGGASGAGSYITLAATETETDDYWNGAYVYIISGNGSGQSGQITDYDGTTKKAYVPLSSTPNNTSVYLIYFQYADDLMKSKWGWPTDAQEVERYYRRNTFIVEPTYADTFSQDRLLLAKTLHSWETYMSKVYMEDNTFDVYMLYFNMTARIKEYVFEGNTVIADYGTNHVYNQAFCYVGQTLDYRGIAGGESTVVTGKSITVKNNSITQDAVPTINRTHSFYEICIDDTADTDTVVDYSGNPLNLKELTHVYGSRNNTAITESWASRITTDDNEVTVERRSAYDIAFFKPVFADMPTWGSGNTYNLNIPGTSDGGNFKADFLNSSSITQYLPACSNAQIADITVTALRQIGLMSLNNLFDAVYFCKYNYTVAGSVNKTFNVSFFLHDNGTNNVVNCVGMDKVLSETEYTNKAYVIDGSGIVSNNFYIRQDDVVGTDVFYVNMSNDGNYYEKAIYIAKYFAAADTMTLIATKIQKVSSLAVTTPPTKVSYTVGESLDLTGCVITATLADASTAVVPVVNANTSGFNSSAPAEDQEVTVFLGTGAKQKTCSFLVDIVAA
jgi:hypothetical protein